MTVWTGLFDPDPGGNLDCTVVEGPALEVCEARLKAAIGEHYSQHPDAPIWDAWMNTDGMRRHSRDVEPRGVMTLKKLKEFREALGRDDVEITVGGRVFR